VKVFNIDNLPLYEAEPPYTRLNKVIVDDDSCKAQMSVGLGIYRKGEKAEMHAHDNSEEVMIFTSGKGVMLKENGESISLNKGIITYVKAGEKHKIENVGEEPLTFWFMYSPGGPERGIRKWKVVK